MKLHSAVPMQILVMKLHNAVFMQIISWLSWQKLLFRSSLFPDGQEMLTACVQVCLPPASGYAYHLHSGIRSLTTNGGSGYACIVFDTFRYRAAPQSDFLTPDAVLAEAPADGLAEVAAMEVAAPAAMEVAALAACPVLVPADGPAPASLVPAGRPDSICYDSYSPPVLPLRLPAPVPPVPAAAMPADRSGRR